MERALAAAQHRPANIVGLLQQWGGVTIAYRKRLIDSPAYTLNHEEIEKAMEEGIYFAQCLDPVAITVDEYSAVKQISFKRTDVARATDVADVTYAPDTQGSTTNTDLNMTLKARSIYVAAGTSPNTVLAREDTNYFKLDGKYFEAIEHDGSKAVIERSICKPSQIKVTWRRLLLSLVV